MKPLSIVALINLSFFAVWALVFFLVVGKPELIPLFTGFQTIINGLLSGISLADRKSNIAIAFLVGFVICLGLTIAGFLYIYSHREEIQGAEFAEWINHAKAWIG